MHAGEKQESTLQSSWRVDLARFRSGEGIGEVLAAFHCPLVCAEVTHRVGEIAAAKV